MIDSTPIPLGKLEHTTIPTTKISANTALDQSAVASLRTDQGADAAKLEGYLFPSVDESVVKSDLPATGEMGRVGGAELAPTARQLAPLRLFSPLLLSGHR